MQQILAYCGLVCQTCPIFLATLEVDQEKQRKKRVKIARLSKKLYGMNFKVEQITDCDGCTTDHGRLFPACKDCPIRNCARAKGLENCAFCPEYPCEHLNTFFQTEPAPKARLEAIRSHLPSDN